MTTTIDGTSFILGFLLSTIIDFIIVWVANRLIGDTE